MKIIKWINKNKVLTILIFIELLFIVSLILNCFDKQDVIYISHPWTVEKSQTSKQRTLTLPLNAKNTAYNVTVKYRLKKQSGEKSYSNKTGEISFSLNRKGVLSDPINLTDGTDCAKSRLWVNTWRPVKDLNLSINYYGDGTLEIKNIILKECTIFRFTKLLGLIFFSVLLDLGYMFLCGRYWKSISLRKKFTVLGIICIIVFSSLLSIGNNIFYGDDLNFHLHRIISLSDAIVAGNIPQRIQFSMIHGYGYASPLYYGELFLLIPALLYLMCVPLQMSYQIFVVIVNAFTCLTTYWCIRRITDKDEIAVICSFLYTCSAYRLVNIYQRCAVGEFTAMAFLPLIIYGFYHLYTKEDCEQYQIRDLLPLIFGLTGVIQSHTLSVEMSMIFIFIFILFNIKKTFKFKRLIALLQVCFFTFILNAWFIVPMIFSLREDIRVKAIQNFIGTWSIDPARIFSFTDTGAGHHLTLGFPFLIGIVLFIVIKLYRNDWKIDTNEMKVMDNFMGLGLLAVFFVLPYCYWDNIYNISNKLGKILSVVQFSWRYLAFATICLVFAISIILKIIKKNVNKGFYCTILIVFVICELAFGSTFMTNISLQSKSTSLGDKASMYQYYMNNDEEVNVGNYFMTGEYLPTKVKIENLDKTKIYSNNKITVNKYNLKGEDKTIDVKNGNYNNSIILPIIYYKNYYAFTQNGKKLSLKGNKDGLVSITIPSNFDGKIFIKYIEPTSWRISEIVSLISLIIIMLLYAYQKSKETKNKKRLKLMA